MAFHPSTPGRRILLAATATLLGATAVVAVAPPAGATPAWAPTSTKAISLANATKLGAASPSQDLRLTIGLAPHNVSGLNSLIIEQANPSSSHYRQFLTPAEFTSRFAASGAAASAVRSYLTSEGMTGVRVSSNRLQVTANSTVANAEKAFNTDIASYSQAGKRVLANVSAAQVPISLAGMVTGVLGLSSLGAAAPTISVPNLNGFYPKDFDTVYHTYPTLPGIGTTDAIIAEGNLAPTVADLRLAESERDLPQVPVTLRYSGVKSPDVAGADEWDLDTQTSTGVAPWTKRLYIYIATSLTDSDLARAINQFASEDVAKSGSASLGECDALPYADGSAVVDDVAFAQAAVQGQTFFASSGDTGSSCAVLPSNGVPASGPPDTEYPASSPYVMGVGGTTLDADSVTDAYQAEIAWNAGGGGVSPVENAPFWQSGVNLASAGGLRGVPDVAFDADPDTGALIYVDGAVEQIGGTSLASPLAMGMWTRLQATSGNKLGFASTTLYNYYTKKQAGNPAKAVPGFHDIVVGGNGAFTALPGYDFTTGLGSWDVAKLSTALANQK